MTLSEAYDREIQAGRWFRTVTQRQFVYEFPERYGFDLVEIAHVLARIPRYAGHTDRLWTVGDHSLLVMLETLLARLARQLGPAWARALERQAYEDSQRYPKRYDRADILTFSPIASTLTDDDDAACLRSLTHDFHEAFIGDLISPFKRLPGVADGLRHLDRKIERAVSEWVAKSYDETNGSTLFAREHEPPGTLAEERAREVRRADLACLDFERESLVYFRWAGATEDRASHERAWVGLFRPSFGHDLPTNISRDRTLCELVDTWILLGGTPPPDDHPLLRGHAIGPVVEDRAKILRLRGRQ